MLAEQRETSNRNYWLVILIFIVIHYGVGLSITKLKLVSSLKAVFISSSVIEVGLVLLFVWVLRKDLVLEFKRIGSEIRRFWLTILFGLLAMMVWDVIFNNLVNVSNANAKQENAMAAHYPIMNMIIGVVFAPIPEELVF